MSKVKKEPADNVMFNWSQTSIGIKKEPDEMEMDNNLLSREIKEETELIIKSEFEWSPTKLEDEQPEYYLEYQCNKAEPDDKDQLSTIQSGTKCVELSIEYVYKNEETDEDDDKNSEEFIEEYLEEEYLEEGYLEEEYLEEYLEHTSLEHTDSNGSSDSSEPSKSITNEKSENSDNTETLSQRSFLSWLRSKHIQYLCPICDEEFNLRYSVSLHINQQHNDLIQVEKSLNYYTTTNQTSQFICKQCYKHLHKSATLLSHSLRHSMPKDTLKLFKCNICQVKLLTMESVEKHIVQKHPDIEETFKTAYTKSKSNVTTYECPLCPAIYNEFNHVRFHFIDKHPVEYGEIYKYPCHLCENNKTRDFYNEQEFFKHLLEEHNLKDWTLMNFDFYPKNSDDPHFVCTKCFKIFTEMNFIDFVRHYLEDINYNRYCSSCCKKYSIKVINSYHMCKGWLEKFQTRRATNTKERTALSSWQEFEEYIKHTCSFCNKKFETKQNWQIHLRELHQLDTLKGLGMEKIPNDDDRLKCNTCKSFVLNSSEQLHTHRFQHLPYKPYKCRHCTGTFDNYKMALKHVLQKCQDQDNQTPALTVQESHETVCPLCDNLRFSSYKTVLKHFIEKHNNFLGYYTKQLDNTMKCNVCQIQIANDGKMYRRHMLLHFARKPYKCLVCSQSFQCSDSCYLHVRFHLAEPINTQEKTKKHSLTHSNEQELNDSKIKNGLNSYKKGTLRNEFEKFINYACPECNDWLETMELWQEHINEKHDFFHEDNLSVKDPIDGLLKCSHCPLQLVPKLSQRQNHKLTHMTYRSFICKLCSYRSNSLSRLFAHFRRIHFVKGSHKCPICPVVLTTPYEKTEHLKNTHPRSEWPDDDDTNEQQLNDCYVKNTSIRTKRGELQQEFMKYIKYACPECNEDLATRLLWEKHINEKHDFFQEHNLSVKDPSDGSLKCSNCRIKLGSSVAERQKHKLSHMPHKGFLCKLCDYRGCTLTLMIVHHKSTHFFKGSYECPICRVISTTPHEKNEHLKNTHSRSEWPELMCRVCCMTVYSTYTLKSHMRQHEKSQDTKVLNDETTDIQKEKSNKRNLRSNSRNRCKKLKKRT